MNSEKETFGQISAIDWTIEYLVSMIKKNKVPIICSAIVSAFTYVFILTNKIVNWDDLQFLFGKGYTLSSGRWGLDLLSYILPDYSMPWLWGLLSLVLLTISICFIISIFDIKNKILQGVLAGAIIAFPSEIGTMFYMFTSSSYAIAFLCSVLAVYFFCREKRYNKLIALLLAVFSLSIYQAYIAVTASFFVLLAIKDILEKKETKDILKCGMKFVLFLGLALAFYYGITFLLLTVGGSSLNAWAVRATSSSGNVVYRAVRSWKLFVAMLMFKTYGLETTNLSMVAHIVCCVCIGCISFSIVWKQKKIDRLVLFLFLTVICLPLSINCIVLLIGENGVHALTLYSFISVYILAAIIIEQLPESKIKFIAKDVVVVTLLTIIICNIYSANKVYLKQYLVYQNSFAFYEQIITQVEMTPGFDENSKLAIIGNVERDSEYLDNFGEDAIYGLCGFKGSAISDEFILQYIGFNAQFASGEEIALIQENDCFKEMPVYPYYGYVQKIDDYIVVKLGH